MSPTAVCLRPCGANLVRRRSVYSPSTVRPKTVEQSERSRRGVGEGGGTNGTDLVRSWYGLEVDLGWADGGKGRGREEAEKRGRQRGGVGAHVFCDFLKFFFVVSRKFVYLHMFMVCGTRGGEQYK